MEKEQDLLFNVADIVKRAKRVLNFKTDAELAAYLGVSRPTLSNWIARNGIDFPLLLEKLKEIDTTGCWKEKDSLYIRPNFATTKSFRVKWK